MTPVAKAQLVKRVARDVGFDLVGVTHATPVDRAAYYRDWIAAGYAGTMAYLRRNVQFRAEPARLLPGARAIVCGAVNYRRADGYIRAPATGCNEPAVAGGDQAGLVAQYARGRDYHAVLRRMLTKVVEGVRERLREPFTARLFVDTGPLLERELAAAAGLGWIGRNTCLLNGRLGSYLLLGELVTTLDLAADEPAAPRCGSCRRCLDACPTRAFLGPHRLNASRCISYLTIEHRGSIPAEFHAAIGKRVFGCDACQQVCPYNARAPQATNSDVLADVLPARVDLCSLLKLTADEFRRLVAGSAAARARPDMWRRNAAIALGNVGLPGEDAHAALSAAATGDNQAIRHAAAASLERLGRCALRQPDGPDARG